MYVYEDIFITPDTQHLVFHASKFYSVYLIFARRFLWPYTSATGNMPRTPIYPHGTDQNKEKEDLFAETFLILRYHQNGYCKNPSLCQEELTLSSTRGIRIQLLMADH